MLKEINTIASLQRETGKNQSQAPVKYVLEQTNDYSNKLTLAFYYSNYFQILNSHRQKPQTRNSKTQKNARTMKIFSHR